MKAHSGKSVNLSDMTVSNEDGYLSRSKTFNSNNKIVKERIWITVKLTIQKLCSEDATLTSELLRLNTASFEPIQGVQEYTCEYPRSLNMSRRRPGRVLHV